MVGDISYLEQYALAFVDQATAFIQAWQADVPDAAVPVGLHFDMETDDDQQLEIYVNTVAGIKKKVDESGLKLTTWYDTKVLWNRT